MIYIDGPRLRAQQNRRLRKRQEASNSISMDSSSGIDSRGPWFDGVEALQSSGISAVDVDAAKSKHIAIVGAGMAGLMIWLVLHEAGFTNITILQSSQELGGRVQRQYFGDPSARQYVFNAKVDGVSYNTSTGKVNVTHHNSLTYHLPQTSSVYDLAVLTPPLPMIRSWTLPSFSPLLSAAISSYTYSHGYKCALQFHTRFWEHLPNRPIYGSCSTTTSIPGIGQICYPSYDINTTGTRRRTGFLHRRLRRSPLARRLT